MKKVGVLLTLNFLIISSFILVFTINSTVSSAPLNADEVLTDNINTELPESSATPVTLLNDDFESGGSAMWDGLGGGSYWHISDESISGNYSSAVHSLRCANSSTGNYNKSNQAYTEILTIKNINFLSL